MKILLVILSLFVISCSPVKTKKAEQNNKNALLTYEQSVYQGAKILKSGQPNIAIQHYFDPVINHCNNKYRNSKTKNYSSRGTTESVYYMLMAAADEDKRGAKIIPYFCAKALYLKGFAKINLKQVESAKIWLEKALELSPVNSSFLSELGFILHAQKNWKQALNVYYKAEEYSKVYTPKEIRHIELTRAMRGIGFSLVELGELDKAEEKYRQCLEIIPNDKKSLIEIEYIRKLRLKLKEQKNPKSVFEWRDSATSKYV